MGLPVISGANPARIHQFYEALSFNVQALETLGKLKEVNGYVRMSIDKLPGIRGDLVRTDENWQEWDFPKFVYALQGWTERNPVTIRSSDKTWRDSNVFNTQLDACVLVIVDVFTATAQITSHTNAPKSLIQRKRRKFSRKNVSALTVLEMIIGCRNAGCINCAHSCKG